MKVQDVSALFLVLHSPRNEEDCNDYTYVEDSMYIVCHKSRFGWPKSKGPGAIILPKCNTVWGTGEGEWVRKGNVPQSTSRKQRKNVV